MHARPKEGPHIWSKMLAEARHPQKQAAKRALPPLENSSAAIFRQIYNKLVKGTYRPLFFETH